MRSLSTLGGAGVPGAGPGTAGEAVEAGGQGHLRGGHAGQLITIPLLHAGQQQP